MARVLTGIQSTGIPHLGNILGAIKPAIDLANEGSNESFLFIMNLHSLTQIKDGATLRENTYAVAATWLSVWARHRADGVLPPKRRARMRARLVPAVLFLAHDLGFSSRTNKTASAT